MEKVLENEFAFLTLLAGVAMLTTGIIFRLFPPKKLRWYNSIPLQSGWQYNEDIQRKAMRWTVKPSIIMAGLFIGLAILSLTFPAPFFTFSSAIFLTIVCYSVAILLRNRYLKRHFDENGNPRKND
jgi:hypothetical protein